MTAPLSLLINRKKGYECNFDTMNKIVPGGYVTLQVPKHLEGWVKGTQGTNIRAWAQAIGVKRINVVPY